MEKLIYVQMLSLFGLAFGDLSQREGRFFFDGRGKKEILRSKKGRKMWGVISGEYIRSRPKDRKSRHTFLCAKIIMYIWKKKKRLQKEPFNKVLFSLSLHFLLGKKGNKYDSILCRNVLPPKKRQPRKQMTICTSHREQTKRKTTRNGLQSFLRLLLSRLFPNRKVYVPLSASKLRKQPIFFKNERESELRGLRPGSNNNQLAPSKSATGGLSATVDCCGIYFVYRCSSNIVHAKEICGTDFWKCFSPRVPVKIPELEVYPLRLLYVAKLVFGSKVQHWNFDKSLELSPKNCRWILAYTALTPQPKSV